ncbi:MAG: hypothetical protein IJT57_02465 [Selenomonadaceae bacterium]|nr:hypothetical protein [Selenomonadaceae bacterium]
MTNLELKVDKIDDRVSSLEQRVTETTTNLNNLIAELRDFKTEMRDRDNQRAAEIIELRQKQEADMKEIRSSIDGMGKHVRNLSVATIIGVATIAITVIYSILSR